mmetsp:Transcript_2812/g.4313  ORF Transcript_2812/g.4313 Transcript_2812/m.4313 type:complete len:96 (+) Transcript_2812:548-835(+)
MDDGGQSAVAAAEAKERAKDARLEQEHVPLQVGKCAERTLVHVPKAVEQRPARKVGERIAEERVDSETYHAAQHAAQARNCCRKAPIFTEHRPET